MGKHLMKILSLFVFLFMITGQSSASIVSVSGSAFEAAAPPSLLKGDFESNTQTFIIPEKSNFTTYENISLQLTAPGTYSKYNTAFTTGTLPSGTTINSYILHSDPVGRTLINLNGSVTFSEPIIGIIFLHLKDTDYLGASGTVYPTNQSDRGVTFTSSSNDVLTLASNMDTLSFHMHTGPSMDQARIITESSVPIPGAIWLLASGLIGIVGFRRKSKN